MAKMTKRTGMMNKGFLVKQLIMIISFHLVIYVLWDVPKSRLLAIISPAEKEPTTGSNKLQRKTKTWGNFEGAIE